MHDFGHRKERKVRKDSLNWLVLDYKIQPFFLHTLLSPPPARPGAVYRVRVLMHWAWVVIGVSGRWHRVLVGLLAAVMAVEIYNLWDIVSHREHRVHPTFSDFFILS